MRASWLGGVLVVTGGAALGVYLRSEALLRPPGVTATPIPVPWPVSEAELDALKRAPTPSVKDVAQRERSADERLPGIDRDFVGMIQGARRGSKLARERGRCADCHEAGLGGRVLRDDARVRLVAPNLTAGAGGVGTDAAAWGLALRHDVGRDGRHLLLSHAALGPWADQEVSDLVAWARSLMPVDRALPSSTVHPLGRIELVLGAL